MDKVPHLSRIDKEALVDKLTEEIEQLKATARCPCGGWLEGTGYDRKDHTVVFDCNKCGAQLLVDAKVWEQVLKGK